MENRPQVVMITSLQKPFLAGGTFGTKNEVFITLDAEDFIMPERYKGRKVDVFLISKGIPKETLEKVTKIAKEILLEHSDQTDRLIYF